MAADLLDVMTRLKKRVKRLDLRPPVAHVYHPLDYAWPVARAYIERFGTGPKEVLFLGMNPGPFGMGQTGVPFGEVAAVRDFLRLTGEITRPRAMHDKRPIEGWDCKRSEVSGQRLWGAIAKRHGAPERFFARAFVANYCPALFLSETGANVALDKLQKDDRNRLEALCDAALVESIRLLAPRHLVGVGIYAAKRLAVVTGRDDVVTMPHPSPASPLANRGWETAAQEALTSAGLVGLL